MASAVRIERPSARHAAAFLRAARASRRALRPWAVPPCTDSEFADYLRRRRAKRSPGYLLVENGSDELVGVVNLNELVRGSFQSAYLGYYVFRTFEGRGFMYEGLSLVLREAFRTLHLHRVEANIQPGNARSLALVRRLGFRREGLSPRYLKVGGKWQDHERWALLSEEWRPVRGSERPDTSLTL